jgi:hypothetical protein
MADPERIFRLAAAPGPTAQLWRDSGDFAAPKRDRRKAGHAMLFADQQVNRDVNFFASGA